MKKVSIKIGTSILIISLLLLSCSGCSGIKQLSERLIIKGVGVDFKDEKFEVTLMYLDTAPVEVGAQNPTKSMSTKGKSVLDCMTNAVARTGREILYSHNLFILVGQEAVKDQIRPATQFFVRYYESRPTVKLFAAEKTAKEIMSVKDITPEDIAEIANTENVSGKTVTSNLFQFVADEADKTQSGMLSTLKMDKEKKIYVDGCTVFKKNKKVGELTPDNSLGSLILMDRAGGSTEVITTEKDSTSFSLSHVKCKLSVDIKEEEHIVCNFDIKGTAKQYELSNEPKGNVKKQFEENVKKICEEVAEKVLHEYECDPIYVGKNIRVNHNEFYKSVKDWDKVFKNAEIKIKVDIAVD